MSSDDNASDSIFRSNVFYLRFLPAYIFPQPHGKYFPIQILLGKRVFSIPLSYHRKINFLLFRTPTKRPNSYTTERKDLCKHAKALKDAADRVVAVTTTRPVESLPVPAHCLTAPFSVGFFFE